MRRPSDEVRASVTQLRGHIYRAGPGPVLSLFTICFPFQGVRLDIPKTHTYRPCCLSASHRCTLPVPIRGAHQAPLDFLAHWLIHTCNLQEQPFRGPGWVISKVAAGGARAIAHLDIYVNTQARPRLVGCGSACTRQRRRCTARIPRKRGRVPSGGDVNQAQDASTRIYIETLAAAAAQAQQQHHVGEQCPYQPPGQPQTKHERRQARPGAAGQSNQGALQYPAEDKEHPLTDAGPESSCKGQEWHL